MPSYRDLYPARWLRPDVIGSNRVRVMVERVTRESLFNPTTKKNEDKLIAKFRGKDLRLILNKTACLSLEKIFQSDDFSQWHGKEIVLSTAKAPNGKDTIVIGALSGQVNSPAPAIAPASAPQTEAHDDDLWDTDQPVDEDFYPDDHPAKAPLNIDEPGKKPDMVHGQGDTPENLGARPAVHGQQPAAASARPLNSGSGPCPACHAPVGKMHATTCTAIRERLLTADSGLLAPETNAQPQDAVHGHARALNADGQVVGSSARPAVSSQQSAVTKSKTFEQEEFDFDAEVYAQMATLYDSGLPLSSELTEYMRKARNADHDSAMKMSATYLKAITTTLQSRLTVSEEEAYMMLTSLVGYRVDAAARPGQLIHGYILKPLRDNSEVAIQCLKELSDVCLTIYSDLMEGAADEQ